MLKEKQVNVIIFTLTAIVLFAVVGLNRKVINPPNHTPDFIYILPMFNAIINSTCAVCLICSFIAIKNKRIRLHKKLNLLTFVLSLLFLISYITVHFFLPEIRYGDINHDNILDAKELAQAGNIRIIYLILLSTHILLAGIAVPLILFSFYYAFIGNINKHKRIGKFTLPIWLYVCITGPIIYYLIKPFYA